MSLKASLANLQRKGARFYLGLAEHFNENSLIRESWEAMSRDLEDQAASLQTIPGKFWGQLAEAEKALERSVAECPPARGPSRSEDSSFLHCLSLTLAFEEPVTLTVYAPLIRRLRMESHGHALDFYVLVKAHIARMFRLILPFSGDPSLIQRASVLLEQFEHGVQAPDSPPPAPARREGARARRAAVATRATARTKAARTAKRRVAVATRAGRKAKSRPRTSALGGRAKKVARRAKPMLPALKLRRRRARR